MKVNPLPVRVRSRSPRRRRQSRLSILFLAALGLYFFYPFSIFSPGQHDQQLDLQPIPFVKSGFDWGQHKHKYAVSEADMFRPPVGRPRKLPRIQHHFPRSALRTTMELEKRRTAVRDVFLRSWGSYKKHAWLHDEVTPITLQAKNTFGGWAATLVDALDTLLIMGLQDEFRATLPAIGALDWNKTAESAANVFETTIRHLGGLLSAHDLSGEPVLLLKATELGDMLYAAFDTPNRLPPFWLDFAKAQRGELLAGTNDPSASPCSLSLEFTRLSQLTGDPKYFDAIERVRLFLARTQKSTKLPGMWPATLNFRDELAEGTTFTLGALSDSLYEYLPKTHALLGGLEPSPAGPGYEAMYRAAAAAVERHLLFRPMLPDDDGADVLVSGDAHARVRNAKEPNNITIELNPEGQHLGCFAGGMFALGGKLFRNEDHVALGERLARGCAWAYAAFPTGVMPEIFGMVACENSTTESSLWLDRRCAWNETRWLAEGSKTLQKGFTNARDPRYILRPEAIESIFLLYRITGKKEFQDVAWTMFQAIENATRTEFANSAVADVTAPPGKVQQMDQMESFWMAETLKYFYLIFSPPDLISLDEFVLNTEAHPLRRPRR